MTEDALVKESEDGLVRSEMREERKLAEHCMNDGWLYLIILVFDAAVISCDTSGKLHYDNMWWTLVFYSDFK